MKKTLILTGTAALLASSVAMANVTAPASSQVTLQNASVQAVTAPVVLAADTTSGCCAAGCSGNGCCAAGCSGSGCCAAGCCGSCSGDE